MEIRPRIAIVDDMPDDRETLSKEIRAWFSASAYRLEEVCGFPGGMELLRRFEPGRYHAVFLDICMDRMDGIETARRLREQDAEVLLLFITTSREYAFDAFPLHPFDYILKPYDAPRLHGVLREMMRVLDAEGRKTLSVRSGRSDLEIPLASLSAAMSQGHAVELCLTNRQTLLCPMAFHELEERLAAKPRFLTCNRGILINMDQVSSLRDDEFIMKDGSRYPLRVHGRAAVVSAFTQYQFSKMHKEASP